MTMTNDNAIDVTTFTASHTFGVRVEEMYGLPARWSCHRETVANGIYTHEVLQIGDDDAIWRASQSAPVLDIEVSGGGRHVWVRCPNVLTHETALVSGRHLLPITSTNVDPF